MVVKNKRRKKSRVVNKKLVDQRSKPNDFSTLTDFYAGTTKSSVGTVKPRGEGNDKG